MPLATTDQNDLDERSASSTTVRLQPGCALKGYLSTEPSSNSFLFERLSQYT